MSKITKIIICILTIIVINIGIFDKYLNIENGVFAAVNVGFTPIAADGTEGCAKHNLSWRLVQSATCTSKGKEEQFCKICKVVVDTKILPKKDHEFEFKKLDSTWHQEICNNCKYSKTMERHNFEADKCKFCSYEIKTESNTTNNVDNNKTPEQILCKHAYRWVVTKKSTCQEKGSVSYICKKCNYVAKTKEKPKVPHKYSIKATCISPKSCKNCGITSGVALGHSKKYVKIANDSENHKVTCRRCNYEIEEKHSYNKKDVCTKCKYKIELPKCTTENIIAGHKLTVKKRTVLGKNNKDYDKFHNVIKYCTNCKKNITILEQHGDFNVKGKCTCGYIDTTKIKCTRSKFVEGHDVKKLGYEERAYYHVINYHCNTCGVDTIRTESHKYNDEECVCGRRTTLKICEHGSFSLKVVKTEQTKDKMNKKHWDIIKCSKCGTETKELTSHVFGENRKCSCGAQFTIAVSSTSTMDGKNMILTPGTSAKIIVTHNSDLEESFSFESNNSEVKVTQDGIVSVSEDVTKNSNASIKVTSNSYSNVTEKINVHVSTLNANVIIKGPTEGFLVSPIELVAEIDGNLTNYEKNEIEKTIKWSTNKTNGNFSSSKGTKVIFTPTKVGKIEIEVTVKINGKDTSRKIIIDIQNVITKKPNKKMTIMLDEVLMLQDVQGLSKISGNSVKIDGNVLKGQSIGTSIFKDIDGNLYEITVTNRVVFIEDVEILIDKKELYVGDKANVTIKIKPENATESYTISKIGSCFDYDFANNKIVGVSEGTSKILVKTNSKNKSFNKEFKVKKQVVEFLNSELLIGIKSEGMKIPIDFSNIDKTLIKDILYSSANEKNVIVKKDGLDGYVKGVKVNKNPTKIKVIIQLYLEKGSEEIRTIEGEVNVRVNDSGFDKIDTNMFVNEGRKDLKYAVIYLPGSGALKGPGEERMFLERNMDMYYVNDKEYDSDIFIYDTWQRQDDDMEVIVENLLKYYGVSSVEEFNRQNYRISTVSFSQGTSVNIALVDYMVELGFVFDQMIMFDCNSEQISNNNVNGKTGEEQLQSILQNNDTIKIQINTSDENTDTSKVLYKAGEKLVEEFGEERVSLNVIEGTTHVGATSIIKAPESEKIMDDLANE